MAAELGQQTVEFSALVRRATEESYLSLKDLVEKYRKVDESRSDSEKKIDLLKFITRTRQRMLRLRVVAKWCQQVPLVQYCQQLASTLSSHETCFTQTADSLFYMHDLLQQARAPIFDIPSAIEVFLTGSYHRLPKCIEDLGIQGTLSEHEQKHAMEKLDIIVRSKLLETSLPKEMSNITVSDGTAIFCVDGEFKVFMTLGYRGHLSLWRILHLELLVGEKNGPIKLEESRRYAIGDDLERRMAAAENPFGVLYTILHELCVALVMDTVLRQVQVLRQSRWKDAIHFELISDGSAGQSTSGLQVGQDTELDTTGLKTPGLKIIYWLDIDKSTGASDVIACPFIKIEPGHDMQIKCAHSSFVLDPLTDKEASFSLDQSCIDVEKLLLRAIACNRHTRLLEIQMELTKSVQLCQGSCDIVLNHEGVGPDTDLHKIDEKLAIDSIWDEMLRVQAYGASYITLGVNIRSGRFLLQSSKNILPLSTLVDCEDALNQGNLSATEVFTILRSKSVLNLFASTGRFFGMQVYDQALATLKIPKSILHGSDFILMGFPQCANSYYLLIQVDKEFKPVFILLESMPVPDGGSPHSASDATELIRYHKIDISQMQINRNELDLSLFNCEKMHALPNMGSCNEVAEHGLLSEVRSDAAHQLSVHSQSSFSSVVDEVFDLFEKSGSDPFRTSNHQPTSFRMPPTSVPTSILSNQQGTNPGVASPNWEAVLHQSQTNNVANASSGLVNTTNPSYLGNNLKVQNNTASPLSSSSPLKSSSIHKLSSSRSAQDNYMLENNSRKRSLEDFLVQLPSFERLKSGLTPSKKRKLTQVADSSVPSPSFSYELASKSGGSVNDNLVGELKHELTSSNLYVPLLLHVVRHCSVCIKHAQLTSQMDSLGISYDEDVGLKHPSSNMWLRLPFAKDDSWKRICLRLGKPGAMCWDVKIDDPHFRDLWELQKGSTGTTWGSGVRIANASEVDSHIRFDPDGVVLSYRTVEVSSIKRLISDLHRLYSARLFACGMRKLIGLRADEKIDENNTSSDSKLQLVTKGSSEAVDKLSEQIRRTFKIEAVGLMSLWFSYGSMPVMVDFVVEWENSKEGCTMHVSPDQLWPHTKFLEDFINGGEVASFLDCIRLTAGPLLALGGAIRPARIPVPVSTGHPIIQKQNNINFSQGLSTGSSNAVQSTSKGPATTPVMAQFGSHSPQASAVVSASGRGGPGIVPSSLLPFDVSVVLRGPYWIRIIYRKKFAVDMRCFAGDQVWLQPATPPKGGPAAGGSLPCPQFRPFIMEHVAQGLNALEPNFPSASHSGGQFGSNSMNTSSSAQPMAPNATRNNVISTGGLSRPNSTVGSQPGGGLSRVGPAMLASSGLAPGIPGMPLRIAPGASFPVHVKGELNTAYIGLGDDGGYGGGWVPLAALKKVLRGILKYLGVLWLFAQLPDLLKEILGSILKENEGALLNLDQEQPALRFYVGGYVFAVSVHRVQLILQVLSVKRLHPQQQPQQNQVNGQEELTPSEISEICDYFSRRVASEPYDASRVASFITLLTLPISALREFLKLISWKKVLSQAHGGDIATAQRARIELCLENHSGSIPDNVDSSSGSKSNIHHDRAHNSVDFALTFVLDHAHIPHMNAAGGAAWLPYCISVRLKYSFGETTHVSFLGMEGSHGGRACWSRHEDWEKFRQRMAKVVEYTNGNSVGDVSQGRLRLIAETLQRTLTNSLQHLRESSLSSSTN